MNIRKNIDYSTMFDAMRVAMSADMSQTKLYYELGRLICQRTEKGAAVAAAEYLQQNYPGVSGLSPRNLRRMRDFYHMYAGNPELLDLAMQIGWTQNVVILEADLNTEERRWYLCAVKQFGWSKAELQRNIEAAVHLEICLHECGDPCYTEIKHSNKAELRRKIESQAHCEVNLDETEERGYSDNNSLNEDARVETEVSHRVVLGQLREYRQTRLTTYSPQIVPSWYRLFRQTGPPAYKQYNVFARVE